MFQPILAEATGAGEKVDQTLTRGRQMLEAAYKWGVENGLKFATAIIISIII